MVMDKSIEDYKPNDNVLVHIWNPQTNRKEWREGVVEKVHTIYPNYGERHKPYPMIFINTIKTYCSAKSQYNEAGIFTHFKLKFYNNKSTIGIIFESELKEN